MNRRGFLGGMLATAAGLLIPEPPRVRVYSFLPGVRPGSWSDDVWQVGETVVCDVDLGLVRPIARSGEQPVGRIVSVDRDVIAVALGVGEHLGGGAFVIRR